MASALCSASSTFVRGTPVRQSSNVANRRTSVRVSRGVVAKYGEEGKYFDLSDLDNTVGSWDMYGSDKDGNRYNSLQADFFERATQPLTRRSSLLAFTSLAGAISILVWGAKGSKDASLPITIGPQTGGEKGPRGKI